jgi:hypothetical protein
MRARPPAMFSAGLHRSTAGRATATGPGTFIRRIATIGNVTIRAEVKQAVR